MTRPLLLDLFCGAGGAAMGYQRAGFDVVGVDLVETTESRDAALIDDLALYVLATPAPAGTQQEDDRQRLIGLLDARHASDRSTSRDSDPASAMQRDLFSRSTSRDSEVREAIVWLREVYNRWEEGEGPIKAVTDAIPAVLAILDRSSEAAPTRCVTCRWPERTPPCQSGCPIRGVEVAA